MEADLSIEPIMIGAEIFIEPGQTNEEIVGWFRLMQTNGMTITRIRLFENYMHFKDDSWDFRLFDQAFAAAEEYGIKIYANLFPETEFSDVGGFKFPKSKENFESITNYIKHVVNHFDKFSSLYGWVPINEPGSGELPLDEFTVEKFAEWKLNREKPSYNSNGFTTFELAEQRFLMHYNSWFLEWLIQQIKIYDPIRPVHVNNHDIFKNVAEYDFPRWRDFLDSLGGSAHASWHFDYFTREQYAFAMSANAELLRSGAGKIPWLMTELQGGNNTYSGKVPICPTKEEIAQWLWINLGAGSRGAIFWCLNPRRSGFEAGEWGLLDFQDQPSDRMLTAASVCRIIADHKTLFDNVKVMDSGIAVVYTRESLWIEKALQIKGTTLEGRAEGGVMKSALSYFEALSEMGIHASFQEIGEYDFGKDDFSKQAIILSHQVSIPSIYWQKITDFVSKGGKLLVDGLTAYYDENAHFIMGSNFPFKKLFGGLLQEFKTTSDIYDISIADPELVLKAHLWVGKILPHGGRVSGSFDGEPAALRNDYGDGQVFWVPALLGLGARLSADYSPLAKLIRYEFAHIIQEIPISFAEQYSGTLLKMLKYGEVVVTVIINKFKDTHNITFKDHAFTGQAVVFSQNAKVADLHHVTVGPEGTLVIKWN